MAITPKPGLVAIVTTGNQPVQVAPGGVNGGLVRNPLSGTDQGLARAEPLYIDPVGPCSILGAGGTIFCLQPGDEWQIIPGQTTPTTVNAASSGHRFSVTYW